MTDIQPTPAAEFRRNREEGELITLSPTGRVVRVKQVSLRELLESGHVPDILADLTIKFLYGEVGAEDYMGFFSTKESKEQALDMMTSLEIVCTIALIEPRISNKADDENSILISDLDMSEQRLIFDVAMMGPAALQSFREEPEGDVEVVDDGENDYEPTVEPDWPELSDGNA